MVPRNECMHAHKPKCLRVDYFLFSTSRLTKKTFAYEKLDGIENFNYVLEEKKIFLEKLKMVLTGFFLFVKLSISGL